MDEYFANFGSTLAVAAHSMGAALEPPSVDSGLIAKVLDLAREVAHGSDRKNAPTASFMAGIAVARLQAAGYLVDEQAVGDYLARVTGELSAKP